LHAAQRGLAIDVMLERAPVEHRNALRDAVVTWPARLDLERTARLVAARRTRIWLEPDGAYPIEDELPDRPVVLLAEGRDDAALARPRVAIVGTRAATPHGLADAKELGAFLAAAGVTIISGLAIGIDAAAHEGALDEGGSAVGVIATGPDIVYPRRHERLYARVRAQGLVLGETGFGVRPSARRFPVRNRIIAALADVVVVVEATRRGGARITAEHAARYGRTVFALPGSRRNPAAAGTNALVADGALPLLDWSDVTIALGLTPGSRRTTPVRPTPSTDGATLLGALGGEPASPDQLGSRAGLPPARLALAVVELERAGLVSRDRGLVWPT
jgi:DNA processing protein